MKPRSPLTRRTPPKRSTKPIKRSQIKRGTKKIRAVNPEREAKRKAVRRKKHAAYRQSETFEIVRQRAAGQCEFEVTMHVRRWYEGTGSSGTLAVKDRCPETEGLEHHHRRYGRQFGGNERPEDMQVLCKQHHRWIESTQHPTRKR